MVVVLSWDWEREWVRGRSSICDCEWGMERVMSNGSSSSRGEEAKAIWFGSVEGGPKTE